MTEGWHDFFQIFIIILFSFVSYFLGSINFSIILSKKLAKDDVRSHGSGNAGTTNMLRNYGKKMAILTILGDMLKVAVAILIGFAAIYRSEFVTQLFGDGYQSVETVIFKSLFGFFCVLGHIYPCFFQFKGGKGVATSGGMVFMIDWRITLILLAIFFLALLLSKMVSLGSVIMAVCYPALMFLFYHNVALMVIAMVFSVTVIVTHRRNIKRIIEGTELKITDKDKK